MTDTQKTELRSELAAYADGLQRYLAIQGVSAKSLDPQLADPSTHINVQLELIAVSLGVPKRVFIGSEQAQLASTQDVHTWNQRVARRREKYLTPYLIQPFIDRLMILGVLPQVDDYKVEWPDIDTPSDEDKADVFKKITEAFAKYVQGDVDMIIPPEVFLTLFAGLTPEQVELVVDAINKREIVLERGEEELEEELPPGGGEGV